jgi:hypothetical protein
MKLKKRNISVQRTVSEGRVHMAADVCLFVCLRCDVMLLKLFSWNINSPAEFLFNEIIKFICIYVAVMHM